MHPRSAVAPMLNLSYTVNYRFYRSLLRRFEPERQLFLAVPESVFVSTLEEPIARPVIEELSVALMVFDPQQEVIVKWIP